MTRANYHKCAQFRRHGEDDAQINGCNDDNSTELRCHRVGVFKKNYFTYLPQSGLRPSSGNFDKEVYYNVAWHAEINDRYYPLDKNESMPSIDLVSILNNPRSNLFNSCNNNPGK